MSGSSHGITKHHFIGCRIGTGGKQGKESTMLYTPAHTKADGKPVSARLVVPILVNKYKKLNPDSFRLIGWGPLADMFAKNLSQGKEMTYICDGESYWGNVFYNNGTQVMQPDGRTPLQTRQTSFTIREFTWGSDSNNTIAEETTAGMKSGEGRRPVSWNIPGTPDNQTWKALLEQRRQTFYQGGNRFGYATVVAPRSPGCKILLGDQSKILRNFAQQPIIGGAGGGNETVLPGRQEPLVTQVHNTLAVQSAAGGTALPDYQAPA